MALVVYGNSYHISVSIFMVCHSILLVSECDLLSAGGFAAHFEDSKQRETTFSLSFEIEMNRRLELISKRTLNDPYNSSIGVRCSDSICRILRNELLNVSSHQR